MTASGKSGNRYRIRAVERALELLEAFRVSPRPD
jgi:hypothetical protein